jgi:hypothetical protein
VIGRVGHDWADVGEGDASAAIRAAPANPSLFNSEVRIRLDSHMKVPETI